MTVTYRIGFRDRLAFAAYHLPRSPIIILLTVGMVLLTTYQTVLPAVRASSAGASLPVRVITVIIMELLLTALIVAFWAVITVLTMISTRNKPLYRERTLTVGDESFVFESEYGRSETKWSIVQKLARTRTHVFLYLSQQSAVIIPRRAFESAAQWDEFYEICRRSISACAAKPTGSN